MLSGNISPDRHRRLLSFVLNVINEGKGSGLNSLPLSFRFTRPNSRLADWNTKDETKQTPKNTQNKTKRRIKSPISEFGQRLFCSKMNSKFYSKMTCSKITYSNDDRPTSLGANSSTKGSLSCFICLFVVLLTNKKNNAGDRLDFRHSRSCTMSAVPV